MAPKTIRVWRLVHKWTSLAATPLLLLLCVTGLPLIFYEEISHLTGRSAELPAAAETAGPPNLDNVVTAALTHRSGRIIKYISFDEHDEPLVHVTTAPSLDAPPEQSEILALDARTATIISVPPINEGVMWVMFKLHSDLYGGQTGTLLLGFTGLLLVVATVSGMVVYGPFMRQMPFGTIRTGKTKRLNWLDLHNFFGAATLAWVLVIGVTGVINALWMPILSVWQADQLASVAALRRGAPPPTQQLSLETAVAAVRQALPGMEPSFIAFPGTPYTTAHHYGVFMRGNEPLTAKLLRPALIDAASGTIAAMPEPPWYIVALLISQPLHFGDYGGFVLKLTWALLDVVVIAVLISGIYLWITHRRPSNVPTDFSGL